MISSKSILFSIDVPVETMFFFDPLDLKKIVEIFTYPFPFRSKKSVERKLISIEFLYYRLG